MAKEYAKKFYNSKAWRKCREAYIISVHGYCERCLERNIHKHGDIVHHKVYITPSNINDVTVTLNHDNLEYVCKECHNKEHFQKYSLTREGTRFNEKGELVEDDA